jgi:TrpR family trp operon transcriptional repressor
MNKLDEISRTLAAVHDEKSIRAFLESILTEKEILDISSRWELVKLLDQGMSQRKIVKELGVSLCKITRGSKELKKENSIFKYFLQRCKSLQ